MTADGEFDTSRTEVKTYVPAYQKDEWQAHAERLGMSQSEFVRTMVQAGRRGFALDPGEDGSSGSNPGGKGIEDRILDRLAERPHSQDELLEALTVDLEERFYDAIDRLQAENRVQYSARADKYTLTDHER